MTGSNRGTMPRLGRDAARKRIYSPASTTHATWARAVTTGVPVSEGPRGAQTGRAGAGARARRRRPRPSLATRHGVSRMTARNAVLVLRQEGLLYVVRGRGVYVARRKLDLHGTPAPLGFTEMARQHGLDAVVAAAALRPRHGRLRAGRPPRHGRRAIRCSSWSGCASPTAAPMCHELTAVPVAVCPTLFRRNLAADSLYRILVEDHGHALTRLLGGGRGRARPGGRWRGCSGSPPADPVLIARRVVYGRHGQAGGVDARHLSRRPLSRDVSHRARRRRPRDEAEVDEQRP